MNIRHTFALPILRLALLAAFALFLLLPAAKAQAEAACPQEVRQQGAQGESVRLLVHAFEPGRFDLAMQAGEAAGELHRISFAGREDACGYQPLALERGGDWGWHLVWLEPEKGVFYARMDGAAWVSSPKKRIADHPVRDVRFSMAGSQLTIGWQDAAGNQHSRMSADEGRSWD